jgi:hypothetical protein
MEKIFKALLANIISNHMIFALLANIIRLDAEPSLSLGAVALLLLLQNKLCSICVLRKPRSCFVRAKQ